jgi:hypothetical protein
MRDFNSLVQTYLKNKMNDVEITPLSEMKTAYWEGLPVEKNPDFDIDKGLKSSPFVLETSEMSKSEIEDFLSLTKYLIDVKCGTGVAIKKFATEDENTGVLVEKIYNCLQERELGPYMDLVQAFGSYAKLNRINKKVFKKQYKNKRIPEDVSVYLFSQMALLFTSRKFHRLFLKADMTNYLIQEILKNILLDANKASEDMNGWSGLNLELPDDIDGDKVMGSLFEIGYFQ